MPVTTIKGTTLHILSAHAKELKQNQASLVEPDPW
uniref:Uncharacterized protein n=1 Tax=Anguilla anguilla TaxID=7936 RepID=A0A0E9Q2V9_ANGAN